MSIENNIPPASDKPRVHEVELRNTYTESDSVSYLLPKNVQVEAQPEAVKFENKFGSYSADFQIKDGKLLYLGKFIRNKGKFPATAYLEMIDFYKKIAKADKMQVVLKFWFLVK